MASTSPISSNPNPIFGSIVNLFYKENETNLVSITVQDAESNTIHVLSVDPNINAEYEIIKVINLSSFKLRLQDAFNFKSLVNIYLKDSKIDSLIIIENQTNELELSTRGASAGGRARCHYGKPPCR